MITFEPFPKLSRMRRGMVITEKLDGTNAQVIITEDGDIGAASRNRLITPEDDNYGFARWVQGNREELLKLGPGRHFGEWFGNGIQRGYGLKEKRFALFNTGRWTPETKPECCSVVPVLFEGDFNTSSVDFHLALLRIHGSSAAKGFMNPEGIVVYHTASRTSFKITYEHDKDGKERSLAA